MVASEDVEARVLLTPNDGYQDGNGVASTWFAIDNNRQPRATINELVLNPDRARSTVVEFTLFDNEKDAVDALLQWRYQGEEFVNLNQFGNITDTTIREQVLADAAKSRALHLLTELEIELEGTAEHVYLSSELHGATALLTSGLLTEDLAKSKTVEFLGSMRVPKDLPGPNAARAPLVFEPGGTFLAGTASDEIERWDFPEAARFGRDSATSDDDFGEPTAMALTPDGRSAYVTDEQGNGLYHLDLTGSRTYSGLPGSTSMPVTSFVTGVFTTPLSIAIPSPRFALVIDENPGGNLLRVDLETKIVTTLVPIPPGNLTAIVCTRDGTTAFVAQNTTTPRIVAVDVTSRNVSGFKSFSSTDGDPLALALRPDEQSLLVAMEKGSTGRILEVDRWSGEVREVTTYWNDGSFRPAVAAGPRGEILYLSRKYGSPPIAVFTLGGALVRDAVGSAAWGLLHGRDVTAGARFQIRRGRNEGVLQSDFTVYRRPMAGLAADPDGVRHRFAWDVDRDVTAEIPVEVRVVPFDGNVGIGDATQIGKSFDRLRPSPVAEIRPNNASIMSRPVSVAIGDLDRDGIPDLVTANRDSDNLTVFRNSDPGFVSPPSARFNIRPNNTAIMNSPVAIALGDMSGDERLDIISANRDSDNLTVFYARTDTGLNPLFLDSPSKTFAPENAAVMSEPSAVAVGDLNGDGELDIVSANRGSQNVTVFLAPFPLATTKTPSYDLKPNNTAVLDQPVSVALDDIDGDGSLDIVTANMVSHTLTVFLQTQSGFRSTPNFTIDPDEPSVFASPRSVALADLNRDGRV
ncbi:FG-GAP-like repeat-containing protein, partial [Planctomycetota bacterium]